MAVDYGIDIAVVDNLPDPEMLALGDTNVAFALARRLTTPAGALEDIGETQAYGSLDLRSYLGQSMNSSDIRALEQRISQVCSEDPRVLSVTATVTLNAGTLNCAISGTGTNGPFRLVLVVSALTVQLIRGG